MKYLLSLAAAFVFGLGAANLHIGPQTAQASGMQMGMKVADMQMQAAMTRMNDRMKSTSMTGNPDRDFMLMMIRHHQSAIDGARRTQVRAQGAA